MYQPIQLTNTISAARNSLSRSPLRRGFPLVAFALAWFALSPSAQAQLPSPTPDGGYLGKNTAEGTNALKNVTLGPNASGTNNTGIGFEALFSNTTGFYNTATGAGALLNNTTGIENTADGAFALEQNTTGNNNTANGDGALSSNANGVGALFSNTTGSNNIANGYFALSSNTTGFENTGNGNNALLLNKTGNGNTAEGDGALGSNTGSFNTALGFNAGARLTTGSNNIDIGNVGVAGESNTLRIGMVKLTATYILGINGATVPGGVGVIIDSSGHLGTMQSSERFKEAIRPMDKASEAILALQPVTFRYKHELDPDGIPQFGLVAEQVEKVNPDLVVRDDEGKVYSVRYEAVNAMLLNEFLKEHRRAEEQRKYFEAKFVQQQKQIEALTATVQKVSDRLELNKPAPQMVADNQ
jgi:hypothetical protein